LEVQFRRLPDINKTEDLARFGLAAYGRFSVLRDGSLWVGGLMASHPQETKAGFYWAVPATGELVVSTRGNILDYALLENGIILDALQRELKKRGWV